MIITELLAVLSISAASGFRVALPLLMIGLMSGDMWEQVPILSRFPPILVAVALVSWTLAELALAKRRLVQRFLQSIELCLSPFVGAITGITLSRGFTLEGWLIPLLAFLGGTVALSLHIVQVGLLYRFRGPSLGFILVGDMLCVGLVLLAFDAPHQGGLIALLLVWLALRTSTLWRRRYSSQAEPRHRKRPRYAKKDPD